MRLRIIPTCRLGEWRHSNDPGTAVLFKRAELSTHAGSSEGGVFCEPGARHLFASQSSPHAKLTSPPRAVRAAHQLWEQAREGSKSYDAGGYSTQLISPCISPIIIQQSDHRDFIVGAGTKNCHHFARGLWNWCVVPQLRSNDMPTDMLAQDLLMAASQITAAAK